MESFKRFEARTTKAKTSVIEARDTTDPALITQMLMPLLEAVGSSVDVPRLRKRVRDDVNIQNAEFPWRRLPFWLVLRVATQRQLCLALGNETGRACYKFLICTVLAQLLEDCAGQLASELTMMLKAKLCRRLAKLEMDKTRACPAASAVYKRLFDSVGPMLKGIIKQATEQVESAWANFKIKIARPIPVLPLYANEQALRLSLLNSKKYLGNLLTLPPHVQRGGPASLRIPPSCDGTMEQVTKFTDRYFNLARLESSIKMGRTLATEPVTDYPTRCCKLAELIVELFSAVGDAYDSNPAQMSIFILNLFDLWVQLDECAVKACPLLRDYAPVFRPELLDVLHLPTLSSMQRLQAVQVYLRGRCNDCRFAHKTIFSEPDENCFAARYLEQSTQLRSLQQLIENASKRSREDKKSEWNNACKTYDDLSLKISNGTCVCSTDYDGSRNVKGCTKCWHWRCRKRMTIAIHEDFLPADDTRSSKLLGGVSRCHIQNIQQSGVPEQAHFLFATSHATERLPSASPLREVNCRRCLACFSKEIISTDPFQGVQNEGRPILHPLATGSRFCILRYQVRSMAERPRPTTDISTPLWNPCSTQSTNLSRSTV
jgi:hypothetical protein